MHNIACQVLDRYLRSTIHFKRRKAESCSVSRSACEEANGQMRSYLSKFLVTQALMHLFYGTEYQISASIIFRQTTFRHDTVFGHQNVTFFSTGANLKGYRCLTNRSVS